MLIPCLAAILLHDLIKREREAIPFAVLLISIKNELLETNLRNIFMILSILVVFSPFYPDIGLPFW